MVDIGTAFVGRESEMATLVAAMESTLAGRGQLVMVAGEPGIGKTRTAQEFALLAEQAGASILWGRCYEGEGAPPFWPWVQIIRSYVNESDQELLDTQMGPGAADIAELVPELKSKLANLHSPPAIGPEQDRFRLFDSISTFFRNASEVGPLVLILEDIHWADKSSLLLLEFLTRQTTGFKILLLCTYRDVEVTRRHPLSHTLGNLVREQQFERLNLEGFSIREVANIVEASSGVSPTEELVKTVHGRTHGNPLFVGEIIRLLRKEGLEDERIWRLGIPEGVREVIGRRLNRLSERCNETLSIAAVIGREFSLAQLDSLIDDLNQDMLLDVLEEALSTRLIEELPTSIGQYQFTHALMQETLVDELSLTRRVRLHARIAQTLEEVYSGAAEAHAAELAHHFAQAEAVLGIEKLVRYSIMAGERSLGNHAHQEAVTHFQRALTAKEGHPSDAETADILFGLGRAQLATLEESLVQAPMDNFNRAFDIYIKVGNVDRAVAVAGYPLSADALRVLGIGLIERALSLVPDDSHEASRLLSSYGFYTGLFQGDYEGAQEAIERSVAIALREGDLALEMRTLFYAGRMDQFHLKYQQSLEKNLRALELTRQLNDPRAEAQASWYTASVQYATGDLEGAHQTATAGLTVAEKLRDRSLLVSELCSIGATYQAMGDWRAAREHSDRGLTESPHYWQILYTRILLEHNLGEYDRGEAFLERLLEVVHIGQGGSLQGYTAVVIPLAAGIAGVLNRLELAKTLAESILSSPISNPLNIMYGRASLALIAVQRSDAVLASEHYAYLESIKGTALAFAMLSVDRLLGLVTHTIGQMGDSKAHFEDALTFCRKGGYRVELAWTCYDYANLCYERHESKKALSLLEEALAIGTELGMMPLTEKITALKTRAATTPTAGPTYPDRLTRREVEVLRLIAAGMSNREVAAELVLSPRTVERHITNIYGKIGARGRADATTYALSHDLTLD